MKKTELKKRLLMLVPLGILILGLLAGLLSTRSALKDSEKNLVAAKTALVATETQLEDNQKLNSELMEDLLEARNQLFMIDMYNEREFYMNEKGE